MKIFAYETFLKAYKVRWNALFCAQNPFSPIGSQWKLCNLIIYYLPNLQIWTQTGELTQLKETGGMWLFHTISDKLIQIILKAIKNSYLGFNPKVCILNLRYTQILNKSKDEIRETFMNLGEKKSKWGIRIHTFCEGSDP